MIKEAIEKILSLAQPNYEEINNRTYCDKAMHCINAPHADTLNFKTLKSIANTIIKEHNAFYESYLIIAVETEKEVCVYSKPAYDDMQRDELYKSVADIGEFQFGKFMEYESMMIALKSRFVQTEQRDRLIQLLGTITEENQASLSDDGFTQSVVVKKGIALKENAFVNPIVRLMPYRTFIEVAQPESEFLVRLQEGGKVALFEADGGAWKLEARYNIAEYLRELLVDLINDGSVIVVE